MRRIVDRKIYDTEKAEELYRAGQGTPYIALYVTRKGNYFLVEKNYSYSTAILTPLEDEAAAIDWLEGRINGQKVLLERFSEHLEEA